MTRDEDASGGRVGGSFRDPSGFVYRDAGGVLRRQVNRSYAAHFGRLKESGLLDALVRDGLMIPHADAPLDLRLTDEAAAVLTPEPVPFFSYPYEWSFGQYRDAALLTLELQERAPAHGMILKDASAFNVTFHGSRATFIDALSFESYVEGQPWAAYAQFCRHFLAPLALMAYGDVRLGALLRIHLDGIPLDLAARLLPTVSWLSLGLALHVHLHARTEAKKSGDGGPAASAKRVSLNGLRGIVSNLRGTIERLRPRAARSHWADYVTDKPYTSEADREKTRIVREMISQIRPGTVWDLGANTGEYAEVARELGAEVVALEQDPVCVEAMYAKWKGTAGKTPVWMDLANPSTASGWAHEERDSLAARGPADCVLALALIHHLRIGNNVPFERIAEFFATIARHAVVEFVPKDDPKPQFLLRGREDIFEDYTQDGFEAAFRGRFDIRATAQAGDSMRTLYWMARR